MDYTRDKKPIPTTDAKKDDAAEGQVRADAGNAAGGESEKKPDDKNFIELSKEAWEKSATKYEGRAWAEDPKKRLAIRTFSRGFMGAMFFAAGGVYAKKSLKDYKIDVPFAELENKNILQVVARGIDTFVGKPIQAVVGAVAGAEAGHDAVWFRQTRLVERAGYERSSSKVWGRSLGEEVVDITFDFFCASIGDALGRDILTYFDPHVDKPWLKNGHVDVSKAVNMALKGSWKYLTYNGGEDWAVGIPYAYFMKGQRKIINQFSPGWIYDFDYGRNGGGFKVGRSGPLQLENGRIDEYHKPHVTGTFAKEGIFDFQTRFTFYNIGTLMYREMYHYIDHKLHGEHDQLYGDPTRVDDPHKPATKKIEDVLKWTARSVLKGLLIMTPAVPFFSVTRVGQQRHNGQFMSPQHGALAWRDPKETLSFYAIESEDGFKHNQIPLTADVYYSVYNHEKEVAGLAPFMRTGPMKAEAANIVARTFGPHPTPGENFNPFRMGGGGFGKALDKISYAQYRTVNFMNSAARWADTSGDSMMHQRFGLNTESKPITLVIEPYTKAAISYTPYMYAKAEFANLWDNGKTDLAAERLIDGAFAMNWGEFKAGASEFWRAVAHKPFADPAREALAQRRLQADTSAPGRLNEREFKEQKAFFKHNRDSAQQSNTPQVTQAAAEPSWRERMIEGKTPEQEKKERTEKQARGKYSFAEQEEQRKALEKAISPSKYIN